MKFPVSFFALLLAASPVSTISTFAVELTTGEKYLHDTQQLILAAVKAGRVADLRELQPEERKVVRSRFLADLLTGAVPGEDVHRNGIRIQGAIIQEDFDLRNVTIPYEVSLSHSHFIGNVIFIRTAFAKAASFDKSTFHARASFNRAKIGDLFSINGTTFYGAVDFIGAEISGQLQAYGARFGKQRAEFAEMRVDSSVFFVGAQFDGPADFMAVRFGGLASFREAVFRSRAGFEGATIATQLSADGANFADTRGVSFNNIKAGDVFFLGTAFDGGVDLVGAEIVNDFVADGACFRSTSESVLLEMKCGRKAQFMETEFAGPTAFAFSTFLDLSIRGMGMSADAVPRLDLSRATIKRQLTINNIKINDLVARYLHAEGESLLNDMTVVASVDLSHSEFDTLDVSRTVWPNQESSFQMQGLTYKNARAGEKEHDSHSQLLKLANESAYAADVYSNLEQFLLRQGKHAEADEAFIAGKRRERQEYLHGLAWSGSLTLDVLSGYGRHTGRIAVLCCFWVLLGFIVFPEGKMELQDPKEAEKPAIRRRQYNRFWYSLGLFLPVVDLKTSELWGPQREYGFLRNYVRVHILLGWILVPILVAAISGLIK